eukprot:TRINITY_DN13584_c0_g1_i1.p1 TRINITY_DN13584_c0_g1~~TRINITY_DN13584_c0_g1_i1.p1  ORF type:complete len:110 (-),score=13.50 TRINITY_DN13584_c0_g1_i1:72-401(-)
MGLAPHLCDHDTAPCHTVRPYILSGYRPILADPQQILASLFYMHNETGNVYTHFAALLAFLALMARHFLLLNLRHHQTADTVVTLLFFGGTITCYALSVYYHLFRCRAL